jgi:hypothetical protein
MEEFEDKLHTRRMPHSAVSPERRRGSVLRVPRAVAYQIVAAGTDVKFLVVAIR